MQEPCSTYYTPQNKPLLISRLDKITKQVRLELEKQGFDERRIHVERMLNMRFDGTDTSLMVLPTKEDGDDEDFKAAFMRVYKAEFGFLLDTKRIVVDDIKVNVFGSVGGAQYLNPLGSWYRQNVRQPRSVCIRRSSSARAKTCRPSDKTGDTSQCLL